MVALDDLPVDALEHPWGSGCRASGSVSYERGTPVTTKARNLKVRGFETLGLCWAARTNPNPNREFIQRENQPEPRGTQGGLYG